MLLFYAKNKYEMMQPGPNDDETKCFTHRLHMI